MRQNKGILALAVLLSLALVIGTVGSTAGASGGSAVAAKKKCKKKKAASSKKKKCKKKKKAAPAPAPLVRATLTWSDGGGNTDYDLYVFDGGTTARAVSNPIPNTSFSGNAAGSSGTETFTDLVFTNPGRNFQFGVCHQDGGNDGSTYSIDYVTADGVHHTDSVAGSGDGFNARYNGPPPPATNTFTCPA